MKLFRYLLSALAGVALFASCIEEEPVASYNLAIDLDKSVVAVGSDGGSATVEVNSGDVTWKATSTADWITFSPASGSGVTKVTITVGESDNDRTGEISLQAGPVEKLITVVQTGNPHGLIPEDPLTCAEASELCLKLASGATTGKKYYVKGIITNIVEEFGTQYGNATFWMGDNEGEKIFEAYRVYYFDNVKYDDPTKQNISEGDNVVVYGILTNYNGTAETNQNQAYLYSLDANTAPVLSCKEPEQVVAASETEATFTIAPKNLTEGWTVSTDASWIKDYTKSGAKDATEIKVSFDANTSAEPREAVLTVKSAGASDLTLKLKQGGYSAVGTLDNPYTVAQVIEAIKANTAAGNVYIKGIVSKEVYTYSESYNTGTFWISDDGVYNDNLDKDFECYSVYWIGGSLEAPVAAADIKGNYSVGDEVVIYGAVTAYTSSSTGLTTYETSSKKAKIYSINWAQTDENGLGSVAYPFNIAGAEKFIDDTQAAVKAATEAGGTLAIPDVAVKGKVSAVLYEFSANYGTASFWISDDGTAYGVSDDKKSTTQPAKDFECYSVYFLENKPWVDGNAQVAVGDEVIVKGQLTLYGTTYETSSKKAYVYSLNGVTEATPAEEVPEVYLNEFDCTNKQLEIYNATNAEVDMTGWQFVKDGGLEDKDIYTIPAALAKVPAKGYAVFTCKQTDAANGPLFGLSGTKGFLIELKKGETLVDKADNLTTITTIPDGQSWGRETDGADKFVLFETPTIGAANGAGTPPADAPKTVAELIAAIPDTATGSSTAVEVDVDFAEPVTVSYVNGKNAYMEDATGGILLYLDNHGLQAGVTIKGQLKVTGYWYNGIPELVSFSGNPTLGQGAVPETSLTIAQLLADYDKYLLRRIKLSGVTVTDAIADGDRNGKISQGTDEIAVYAQINNGGLVLAQGAVGDLITIPGYYKTTKQVYFWQNDWFTSTATDVPPTITASDITNVPAEGVTDAVATVTFANNEGWAASATPDGTVVTAASIDGTSLKYTVAANTASEARDGKITITLKKDGKDDVTKEIKVSQKAAESSTLEVGTVLWAEGWDGAVANDEVSDYNYKGTTVFGGASVTYTFTDAGTNTKLYVDNQMDSNAGNQGNLLVSKGNGSFSVAGIPVEGVRTATLTIYISNKNYPLELTTTTAGVQLGERVAYGESAKPYKLTWEITNLNATTLDLTLTNVNSSNNNRLDNMSLVVTELGDAVQLQDGNGGIPDYGTVDFQW